MTTVIARNRLFVSIVEKDTKDLLPPVRLSEKFSRKGNCTVSFTSKPVNMKFLFLNCRSVNTAKYDIVCLYTRLSIDILCLNETWEDPNNPLSVGNWSKVTSKARPDKHGGVAIFTSPDSDSFTATVYNSFDRAGLEVCACKIITNLNKTLYLLCAYVPPQSTYQMLQLSEAVAEVDIGNIMLVGDLNGKSPEWNNNTTDRHDEIVEDMLTTNRLLIHNDGQPTRRGTQSVIDLIITSTDMENLISSCSTLTHETVRSDHIPIITDINVDIQKSDIQRREIRSLKKADWHNWRERTEADFDIWLLQDFTNFEEAYDHFANTLSSAFDDMIPVQTVKASGKRSKPCWWDEKVKEAKKSLNHFQRNFKKRNTIQNKLQLVIAEEAFSNAKEAQERWAGTLIEKFENSRNLKERWSAYKKLANQEHTNSVLPLIQESEPVFETTNKCKLLIEVFFDSYARHEDNQFDKDFFDNIMSSYRDIIADFNVEGEDKIFNRDITLEEVEGAISKLKTGKAAGPDTFPPDLFIQAGDNMRTAIHRLFSMSWDEGLLPEAWKSADVKFLRKPGKTNYYSPSSYRPISLTSCLVKIMEKNTSEQVRGSSRGE